MNIVYKVLKNGDLIRTSAVSDTLGWEVGEQT